MSLLFRPRHNTAAQISLFVAAAGALGGLGGLMVYVRTPYARGMQDPVEQPFVAAIGRRLQTTDVELQPGARERLEEDRAPGRGR